MFVGVLKKPKKEIWTKLCIYIRATSSVSVSYDEIVQHPRTGRDRSKTSRRESGARGPRRRKCKGPPRLASSWAPIVPMYITILYICTYTGT